MTNRPAVIAPLDLEEPLLMLEEDHHLCGELLQVFLDTLPQRKRGVFDAVEAESTADLAKAAHALKSGVSTFAANPTYLAMRDLELAAREGELGKCEALVREAMERLAELEQAIRDCLLLHSDKEPAAVGTGN